VTLLSYCYKGTPEEVILRASALDIILEYIFKNPSTLNYKIIECEIPYMMLTMKIPTQFLKPFFSSYGEESGQ